MLRGLAIAWLAAACYRPSAEQACAARCTADDSRCPNGTTCGADFSCHAIGAPDCLDAAPDTIWPCYGKGLTDFDPFCPDPAALPATLDLPADLQLAPGQRFDTGGSARCTAHVQQDGTNVCILIANEVTVSDDLAVAGTLPLVVIAAHDLTVQVGARLRVDSAIDQGVSFAGPGHNDPSCDTSHVGKTTSTDGYSGGGAGGAFGDDGGAGGDGHAGAGTGGALTSATSTPTRLRGGCGGVTGGSNSGGSIPPGGAGGGGLYLIAGDTLVVDGIILASGAGGPSSAVGTLFAGTGGGSGGMLAFEAPTVRILGFLLADGGGGSGGTGVQGGNIAGGDDGGMVAYATGGAGTDHGGAGGDGSSAAHPAGAMGLSSEGLFNATGGGGGGGTGFILLFSPTTPVTAGTISPPPQITTTPL